MVVIDEYLAVRVLLGRRPPALPLGDLLLPSSRHWRLLQTLHNPRGGQLSQLLAQAHPAARDGLRRPDPELVAIADPRPLLDDAAIIATRLGTTGWLIAETLAAGVANNNQLWFGSERNIGRLVTAAADQLGISIHLE